MNRGDRRLLVSRLLLGVALLLAVLIGLRLLAFASTVKAESDWVTQPNDPCDDAAKALEQHLASNRERAAVLKKKNAFVPPAPPPQPPKLTGILGSKALVNGAWHKVGDNVAGAKIISISTAEIMIEWEGKEKKLSLTAGMPSGPASTRKAPRKRKQKQKQAAEAVVEGPAEEPVAAGLSGLRFEDMIKLLPPGLWDNFTPEQKAEARKRWDSMSEEEKQKMKEQAEKRR